MRLELLSSPPCAWIFCFYRKRISHNSSLVFTLALSCMHVFRKLWIMSGLTRSINCVGNPRVTPEVTRDVCLLARLMAANLYYSQIEELMFEVCKAFFCFILLYVFFQSRHFQKFSTGTFLLFQICFSILFGSFHNFVSFSYLCGVALMNFVFVPRNITCPRRKIQSTT